jgi:hypothetical protein
VVVPAAYALEVDSYRNYVMTRGGVTVSETESRFAATIGGVTE